MKKFEENCTPRKNTIYERHLFNNRSQQKGESFDQFYSDLCQLSQTCDFDNMGDQMIWDRIVVGIYNSGLREGLFRLRKDLTLTKAVDVCCAWEATTSQVDLFKNTQGQTLSENAVFHGKIEGHGKSRGQQTSLPKTSGQGTSGQSTFGRGNQARNTFRKTQNQTNKMEIPNNQCKWCGFEPHDRRVCLHVKQHVIIAMPWDIINKSATKGPKNYTMYRTIHLHKAMYQNSVMLLISLDILQKRWVEFLP